MAAVVCHSLFGRFLLFTHSLMLSLFSGGEGENSVSGATVTLFFTCPATARYSSLVPASRQVAMQRRASKRCIRMFAAANSIERLFEC